MSHNRMTKGSLSKADDIWVELWVTRSSKTYKGLEEPEGAKGPEGPEGKDSEILVYWKNRSVVGKWRKEWHEMKR